MHNFENISTIAFDADDTLWVNELNFRETEAAFYRLMEEYGKEEDLWESLFDSEMKNIPVFGFGAKTLVICMMETAAKFSGGKTDSVLVDRIIELGRELVSKPMVLFDGTEEVLSELKKRYNLILATKGDLLEQERKIRKSGLAGYFGHIEIMSDKKKENYARLLDKTDCRPENFLMVGNSVKSDIVPVLEIGGYAIHIPYHIVWEYEKHEEEIRNPRFMKAENISALKGILL